MLFEAPLKFSVRATSYTSILKLDWETFEEKIATNDHLETQFNHASDYVNKIGGVPMLDYIKFRQTKPTWREKLKETVRRACVITKLNKEHSESMITLIRNASAIMKTRLEDNVAAMEEKIKEKLRLLKAEKMCQGGLSQMFKAAKDKK